MAGTEMQRVVDEDDDIPRRSVARSSWDWNKICAYHTNRVVRIQDANLGYLYWGIVTIVVLYIQIVVFHIEGRHTFQDFRAAALVRGKDDWVTENAPRKPGSEFRVIHAVAWTTVAWTHGHR